MNDFKTDLKYSRDCEVLALWERAYKWFFPNMQTTVAHGQDGDHQRAGIDRSIVLDNSKQILIDEKARRIKDTGDIMLEYVANDTKGSPGWVEKRLLCDFIAYAFIPSRKVYLLPVIQLQAAWARNKVKWLKAYGTLKAKNQSYGTLNCPVSTPVLFKAIGGALRYSEAI